MYTVYILLQVYCDRHFKAEQEEQVLWEKWQTMREQMGKSVRGRSKSRRWREVLLPHRLRTGRVSSLQSEDSFSGRLSPSTQDLREIHVSTAPPTPLPEEQLSPILRGIEPLTIDVSGGYNTKDIRLCDISIEMPPSPPISPILNTDKVISITPKCRFKATDSLLRRTRANLREQELVKAVQDETLRPLGDQGKPGQPVPREKANPGSRWVKLLKCNFYLNKHLPLIKFLLTNLPNFGFHGKILNAVKYLQIPILLLYYFRTLVRSGGGKRLNSPRKALEAPGRELYPLRSQSFSRRTRQGARR